MAARERDLFDLEEKAGTGAATAGYASSEAGMSSFTDEDDSLAGQIARSNIEIQGLKSMVLTLMKTVGHYQEEASKYQSAYSKVIRESEERGDQLKAALELLEKHRQDAMEARKLAESASTASQTALETAHHAEEASATAMERSTEASVASESAQASASVTEVMATEAREASVRAEEKATRAESSVAGLASQQDKFRTWAHSFMGWARGHTHSAPRGHRFLSIYAARCDDSADSIIGQRWIGEQNTTNPPTNAPPGLG